MSQQKVEASFSTLILSIGSTAAMGLGLAPHPQTGKTEIDLTMARFNIDMLDVLQDKTKNNLLKEESDFLNNLIADLRLKYVELSKK
jgi:Domain of unknown function (DUF1844)